MASSRRTTGGGASASPSASASASVSGTTGRASKRKQPQADMGSQAALKKRKTSTQEVPVSSSQMRPSLASRKRAAQSKHVPSLEMIQHAPTDVLAVLAFGNGEAGELGLGPSVTEAARPQLNTLLDPVGASTHHIVQLDCGGMHTVALTSDNNIVTWGVNDEGALGRSSVWEGKLHDIDDDSEDEGELNPLESTPYPVPAASFPPDVRFVQVAAGDSCSLALTETGAVYGWGTFKASNSAQWPLEGRCACSSTNTHQTPDGKKRFGHDKTGRMIENQDKPRQIENLHNIKQLACGANHALALDVNGTVWSWGSGERQQLGRRPSGRTYSEFEPHPMGVKNVKYIASGEYHSFAIDNKDNVWAWGTNRFGEAGFPNGAGTDNVLLPNPIKIADLARKGVVQMAGGLSHSAAVTTDGDCFVWGRVDVGQLGMRFSPEQVQDEKLIRCDARGNPRICLRPTRMTDVGRVKAVACGTDHTLFVTAEGTALVSGFNAQYQLGVGHDEDVEVARRVKGAVMQDRVVTWAGAGGQFSMVAAPAKVGTHPVNSSD